MKNKISIFRYFLLIILAVSCKSVPETVPTQVNQTIPQSTTPVRSQPAEERFDPMTVTQTQYNTTKEEVQLFIRDLNRIIRNRNYNGWRAALSTEYFNEISSVENLQRISEQPALKNQKIVLRTAQDYFTNVVVPSRANNRVDETVDDLEFIGTNRVKAYTIRTTNTGEEQRLRLYDLEKIGNSWKIIN
ncbi:MAG: hypothetical protein LBQ93_08215 [Treponema sp.]|jgi:hypothetical protein|nr:hypothetical protein [Treponema sp.]